MHFQVMAKPTGASCNLGCKYCFYTEKHSLYGGHDSHRMSLEVLEEYVRQYIESQEGPEVQFAWQGGEPTLMEIEFFRSAINLQRKYCAGKNITNSIQTNGTLLTDEWCAFLKENNFLVGISIDGPRELHDRYRVTVGGRPTFDSVMNGVENLKKYGIEFNTLTVINRLNSRHPLEVYRFLKSIGDGHMQFIPAVERMPGQSSKDLGLNLAIPPSSVDSPENLKLTSWSVLPDQFASFYISIFNEWVHNDVGEFFIQFFDVTLGNWLGAGSGLCHFSPKCGQAGALEHNGDIYSCDHYVYPQHKLGNILEAPLAELMESEVQVRFGDDKLMALAECCTKCEVRFVCHGDCPKHRFNPSSDGTAAVSYLCTAYKQIFTYMAPYMDIMAQLVRAGRPVPEIKQILLQQEKGRSIVKPSRNSACPCGSGKKYKRCCGI
ncbi:anaerobic sulfatase maturase [Maridesulfovibrio frigidus]|uniref:anaerobic sulfatase maturase n=1 Tax=Maridesulfovibrio frigidus TaxID=340956 RepID=UPI000A3D95C8|nr:anaerobic sulfatase maturase [Maridesulfovibrio frigidus]